jgi:FAD/FMN-containing dehydrogenase
MSGVGLQQMHGAASRVGQTETAFAHRYQQYDMQILAVWTNPAETEKNVDWARGFWQAMQPFVERGVYVNNLSDEEGEDRVRDAYGPNYERLVALKNKFDPTNLFHMNQNIRPTMHDTI